MASDEIVWQIINQQFCSFKLKTTKAQNFCRNEYNVTGLCSRQSCPLANSRYATIRASPSTGVLYLCLKTIERAHTPAKLWQRIKLSQHYPTALSQIDKHLPFWPKFLVHKCKQRLTRLTQVAIRTRRLAKEEERLGEKVVSKLPPKVRRREATRERKAEAAARVERAVERELLERLRSGAYGDKPLNVEEGVWKKVLRGLEKGGEADRDVDLDEGIEDEEEGLEEEQELEREGVGAVEYVSDDGDEDEEDDEDVADLEEWLGERSEDGQDSDEADEEDEEGEDSSGTSDGSPESGEEDFTTKPSTNGKDAKKRKRGPAATTKGDKKAQRKKAKPMLEIEYEPEVAPAEREAVLAR